MTRSKTAPLRPHRFELWLPRLSVLVKNPVATGVCSLILGFCLSVWSLHWALAPACLYVVLIALRLEWEILRRVSLPPLLVLFFFPAIGAGVGIPVVVSDSGDELDLGFLTCQLTFIAGAVLVMAGYRLVLPRFRADWFPEVSEYVFRQSRTQVLFVGYLLMIYDLTRLMLGLVTGGLDRGYAGEALIGAQNVGTWNLIGIFARWSNVWFFFLPAMWKWSGLWSRILLGLVLIGYFGIAIASGSRGLLFYPVVIYLGGIFFFVDLPRFRPERWLFPSFLVGVALIYFLDVYRNSEGFRESKLTDLPTRLVAAREVRAEALGRADFASTVGMALVANSDQIVYSLTPSSVPFCGGEDILPAMLWTWVPHIVSADRPVLWDSNEIVVSYTGVRHERSWASVTLAADLYRRFGWLGVAVGLFIFGMIYGAFVRGVFWILLKKSVIVGVVLVGFLIAGVQARFSSSVLQTWWIWAYDLPKHLVPVLVFVIFSKAGGVANLSSRLSRS
jgi:hypothetical protein